MSTFSIPELDKLFGQFKLPTTQPTTSTAMPDQAAIDQFMKDLFGTSYSGSSGSTPPKPTPTYTPIGGYSAADWEKLMTMSQKDKKLADLISQFTGATTAKSAEDVWRRRNPTDNTELLRQLSFNAGEMGMPGGYVGGVQLPAYGSNLQPVSNLDPASYGRTPGYGEATFYQQSMKGGMAPISAMSPMGVPQDWKPGDPLAASQPDLKKQLDAYLKSPSFNTDFGSIYQQLGIPQELLDRAALLS